MKNGLVVLAVCAVIAWIEPLYAQTWQPVTFSPSEPISVVTTGGVSYAEYAWLMGGCMSISNLGPLVVEGRDLSFDFEIQVETGVPCPEFVYSQYATVVLGVLKPGVQTLTTTSWATPVATNIFTIAANPPPMLQALGFAANGSFQMQLNGVANVAYVLQSSTNLTDWSSLSTNSAGPLIVNPTPVLSNRRYYRAEIPQTINLHL